MGKAVFPKGVFPWTDRIDLVNTIFANDPNSLAAEVGAIESTLGAMPQVANPISGTAITYNTVSARIQDVQMGNLEPVVTVVNPSFQIKDLDDYKTAPYNSYNKLYDPFGWYNGSDITVKVDGWYTVTVQQTVDWWSTGFVRIVLLIGGTGVCDDFWDWDFPANVPAGRWKDRDKTMTITWQGIIHAGQRVRVTTENATQKSQLGVESAYLRVKWDRSVYPNTNG